VKKLVKPNHDAEAFLKPVSRIDVPDYYDGGLSLQQCCIHLIAWQSSPDNVQASPAETVQNQAGIQKDDLDLIW
jgi:hypothetical protein